MSKFPRHLSGGENLGFTLLNFTGTYTINGMDSIEIIKINNLENYNLIQTNNLFLKQMFDNDIFTLKELQFGKSDYLLMNELS